MATSYISGKGDCSKRDVLKLFIIAISKSLTQTLNKQKKQKEETHDVLRKMDIIKFKIKICDEKETEPRLFGMLGHMCNLNNWLLLL